MISKEKYEWVKRAIKVHNKLNGRKYLILYKVSAKQLSKYMETAILEENFWHLVGCKIDNSLELNFEQKHQLYCACVMGKDISDYLVYTRQAQDVPRKANVVMNIFDFVANAKSIRLCHTDGAPEAAMFRVGAGSLNGVIGYSDAEKGMVPKTAQQKSIYKICAEANDKIFLIISKVYGHEKYDRIDYALSPKIFPEIINELPAKIQYETELFSGIGS